MGDAFLFVYTIFLVIVVLCGGVFLYITYKKRIEAKKVLMELEGVVVKPTYFRGWIDLSFKGTRSNRSRLISLIYEVFAENDWPEPEITGDSPRLIHFEFDILAESEGKAHLEIENTYIPPMRKKLLKAGIEPDRIISAYEVIHADQKTK